MKCSVNTIFAAILLASSACAQTAPKPPEFAVATIKPFKGDDTRSSSAFRPYGFSFTNIEIQMILREVYGLEDKQIVGAPDWVKSARFSIEAKADDADRDTIARMNRQQRLQMLQPLLEDRFKLKFHYEMRQLPHYELVVAKSGPKFRESPPPAAGEKPHSSVTMGRGDLKAMGVPMDSLAKLLSEPAGNTIVDKSGLNGHYDLVLHWTPDDAPPPSSGESNAPSLVTAIQEQLGLKLESVRAPVQVMVIDHIEQPTPD